MTGIFLSQHFSVSFLQPAKLPLYLLAFILAGFSSAFGAAPFDAAPFGLRLPEGNAIVWEDPREIHRVAVTFAGHPPPADTVRLEYWGSRWPEQHLPKDREPGGGDVGWMELGNWYKGGWRAADAEVKVEDSTITFSFRPISAKEFPKLKSYPASFRYTLKLRVVCDGPLPKIERLEAFTDSLLAERSVQVAWKEAPRAQPQAEAFNGRLKSLERVSPTTPQ